MKFNELLLLAEAMDRRQFLKMLGKAGTVAGVTPGAVGKMAMNLATGDAASKDNLTNFISKYFLENPPFYANEDYGGWIESIDELDSAANSVNNAITPVINAFNGSGVNLPPHLLTLSRAIFDQVDEVKSMVEYSKLHPDEIPEGLAIEEGESMLGSIFDADGVLGDFNKELLSFGFKTNRINSQTQKYLEDNYDVYKCDFVNDSESKVRRDKKEAESKKRYEDYEKEEYKRQQQHTAKDINYSRMDRAGGSEDVGYAKYYEMKQNTDSRLIFEAYSKVNEVSDGDKRYNEFIKKLRAEEQAEYEKRKREGAPPIKNSRLRKIPGQINFDIKKDPHLPTQIDPTEFDLIYMQSPDGEYIEVSDPGEVEIYKLQGWEIVKPKAPSTEPEAD